MLVQACIYVVYVWQTYTHRVLQCTKDSSNFPLYGSVHHTLVLHQSSLPHANTGISMFADWWRECWSWCTEECGIICHHWWAVWKLHSEASLCSSVGSRIQHHNERFLPNSGWICKPELLFWGWYSIVIYVLKGTYFFSEQYSFSLTLRLFLVHWLQKIKSEKFWNPDFGLFCKNL